MDSTSSSRARTRVYLPAGGPAPRDHDPLFASPRIALLRPPAVPPARRQGRTALRVHGLALLCAGMAIGLSIALKPFGESAGEAVSILVLLLGAAAVVLAPWSALLSARALAEGERAFLPAAVLIAAFWEAAALAFLPWLAFLVGLSGPVPFLDEAGFLVLAEAAARLARTGLPVLLPFLAFATTFAVPFAVSRVGRGEERDMTRGQPPWTAPRRFRQGLRWYGNAVAVLAILLLPVPLYVFCVLGRRDSHWQNGVAQAMPAFVKEAAFRACGLPGGSVTEALREEMMASGTLPLERCLRALVDSNPAVPEAVYRALAAAPREELIPELLALADGSPGGRQAVHALLASGWIDFRWVREFFSAVARDPDPKRRLDAAEALDTVDLKSAVELRLLFLRDTDPRVRLAALQGRIWGTWDLAPGEPRSFGDAGLDRKWVERLVALLDDPDLGARFQAASVLADHLGVGFTPPNLVTGADGKTEILGTPGEPEYSDGSEEIKKLREAARVWLTDRK